jgi:hypothetical protein
MEEGRIVVDSIAPIAVTDVTYDLARESGFESVDDLLRIARHGSGDKVYLNSVPLSASGRVGHAKAEESAEGRVVLKKMRFSIRAGLGAAPGAGCDRRPTWKQDSGSLCRRSWR